MRIKYIKNWVFPPHEVINSHSTKCASLHTKKYPCAINTHIYSADSTSKRGIDR